MNSVLSEAKNNGRARQWLLQLVACLRVNIWTIAIGAGLTVVISKLGGIWHEVRQMRNEQVKNATYALSLERRAALRGPVAKRLESTAYVNGEVTIDGTVAVGGTVDIAKPVEVEIVD